jgi:asparagine synthase (glutamine-hydrolysing)
MCGIVGLHGPQDETWIEDMNALLVHRGPDDAGVFRDRERRLALAMRRLSIIDLAGGHQPMSTPDGRFTIVYNGELYNAPALRAELEARGVRFATDHSDTEVLLQLYTTAGEAMLARLNGMFAFVVYDRDRRLLFCARDHMGIKPFYYASQGGRFAFASELKALAAAPFLERRLDRASLFHYASLMYVPGEATILDGVRRLPAGHSLTYRLDDGALRIDRWYRPAIRPNADLARDPKPVLRAALAQAVRRWMLSDVPVACSLSGGLDSSAIVGLLASNDDKVKTYSVGFSGAGEAQWNELPLARLVAEKWGTEHHELVLEPEALLEDLPAMVWALDEPYGGGLPSWLVFKFMRREVKVGLTGTGGDELFGSYGKWRELEGGPLARAFGPRAVDTDRFRREFFERYYYFPDADKRRILFQDGAAGAGDTSALLYRHYEAADAATIRDRVAATDLATQLPEEFLMMTDRFSMAHSVEARTPFLDRELVELVLSVPAHVRTRRNDLKYLLRETVADLLPPALLSAPKRGFVIPLKLWLRQRLRPLVERLLAPERLARQGIFRPEFHRAFVAPHLDGTADHTNKVWAALMFQLWHELYIEAPRPAAPRHDLAALTE